MMRYQRQQINSFSRCFLSVIIVSTAVLLVSRTTSGLSDLEKQIHHLVEEEQEAVGLEIYISKGSEDLYHQTWGWKDKAGGIALPKDLIYNIRSMTKPMVGALVHRFVARGDLNLDDKVSTYLPSFDNPLCRDLTLRQMMLHRAGYVQGMPGKSWTRHTDLASMVTYWGQQGPQNPGNENWSYADAHADIVARVLEVVSGKRLEQLFRDELFEPLYLEHTFVGMPEDISLQSIAPLHRGSKGAWTCMWRPANGPFYPFAMGAQSVFSTAKDYASFMQMYLDNGLSGGNRVLEEVSIASTFANRESIPVPAGLFPLADLGSLSYGHFWGMVQYGVDNESDLPDVFMHQGSDGTAAYAFSERKIVVVVMTQSRGTVILPKLERLLLPLLEALLK